MTTSDRANVLTPAFEFAKILAADPKELNQTELARGNNILLVYSDENFGVRFPDLKDLKLGVIKLALEDISSRAQILSGNTIGITFLENRLQTYLTPFGCLTEGTIVYKIGIKNIIAFEKWRKGELSEISQEDINSAIYRLAYEWSKLLK
jgi:hypothetical protein